IPLIARERAAIGHGTVGESLNAGTFLEGLAKLAPRHFLNLIDLSGFQTDSGEEFFSRLCGGVASRSAKCGTALCDGAMEQTLCRWHGHQSRYFSAAARLPENCHIAGIAAEGRNVFFDPGQSSDDVLHSDVTRIRPLLAAKVGEVKKTKQVQSMVDS